MKKILFLSLFISFNMFGQSLELTPSTFSRKGGISNDISIYKNSSDYPTIIGLRSAGTQSLPTNTASGMDLLVIGAGGYANGGFTNLKSYILFKATQSWTTESTGAKMTFSTTSNGNIFSNERMVINHDGKVGIGVSTPNEILDVNGRMRLRHTEINNIPYSSGVWMNNSFNSLNYLDGAFHGMKTDTETGIFIGGYWRFWVKSNGNVVNTGFTQLGDNVPAGAAAGVTAPGIKTMYLTSTTASTQGDYATVQTGLTSDKVLSYTVFVVITGGNLVPPEYNAVGFQYSTFFEGSSGNIYIVNVTSNSAAILSKEFRVFVTYRE